MLACSFSISGSPWRTNANDPDAVRLDKLFAPTVPVLTRVSVQGYISKENFYGNRKFTDLSNLHSKV
ncbi:hypothetical protein AJ88_23625 [Mesorhizobium amorphae CCBAU 01583]|nr:hypothetical protein AJ88_23625 [Mesorhizobium amorphae CCBAU 01583]